MIKYEYRLDCRFDSRKSFYGKAVVEVVETEGTYMETLFSYGTRVAEYVKFKDSGKQVYKHLGKWSQTTSRHQREFFHQLGLSEGEMKELYSKGVLERE